MNPTHPDGICTYARSLRAGHFYVTVSGAAWKILATEHKGGRVTIYWEGCRASSAPYILPENEEVEILMTPPTRYGRPAVI